MFKANTAKTKEYATASEWLIQAYVIYIIKTVRG